MQGNFRKPADPELTKIGAHFFASCIVLNEPNRATSQELERARTTQDQTIATLRQVNYAPEKAFIEPIPNDENRHIAALAGQDGRIPNKEESEHLIIPGPMIQQVQSMYYESWFHSLKRQ
ncbi:hypothetical protein [Pseudomonas sp. DWR1-3-2b2]|uniref:hypothetical protein n=1 Tax=unclassified Pseudomonas TaxID=196821 RepID=UPI003CE91359